MLVRLRWDSPVRHRLLYLSFHPLVSSLSLLFFTPSLTEEDRSHFISPQQVAHLLLNQIPHTHTHSQTHIWWMQYREAVRVSVRSDSSQTCVRIPSTEVLELLGGCFLELHHSRVRPLQRTCWLKDCCVLSFEQMQWILCTFIRWRPDTRGWRAWDGPAHRSAGLCCF